MLLLEQSERRSNTGIIVLVMAIVCFVGARTHADPDLWGHVRFGQDILASRISTADPYSYLTGDQPWINHELLPEILFGAAFNALGVPGLVGLKVGLILMTLGMCYWRLLRSGLHPLRAGQVLVVVVMLMSVGLWTLRPHLFTYLFFLTTLLLLDAAERGSKGALWMLPVVMLVWANAHGGFLAGLGVVAIWTAVHIIGSLIAPDRKAASASRSPLVLAVVGVICIAATLVNPYGVHLLSLLLRTATFARPEIGEWQPISITSPEGIVYLAILALSIVSLLASARPRRQALLAVLLVTALLPMQALRHLPLFALSFAVIVGDHLADVWNRWSPSSGPSTWRLPPAVAFVSAALFLGGSVPHFACIRIDPSFVRFPARAVALMRDAGVQGNLATFFDWGEYIIWHLGPAVRVSIDGRRETVYSPEVYRKNMQFLYGVGDWDAILNDPRTDMALVGRDQPTYNLIRLKAGWVQVYEDSLAVVFARPDSPQADAMRRTVVPDMPPDGGGLCFP
jgi:hypothetical protein